MVNSVLCVFTHNNNDNRMTQSLTNLHGEGTAWSRAVQALDWKRGLALS